MRDEDLQPAPPAPSPPVEAPTEPPAPSWSEEDETFARMFGWKPQEEFSGDRDWEPADKFAERHRSYPSTVRKLQKQVEEAERKAADGVAHASRALEQIYRTRFEEMERQRQEAGESGDWQEVQRLERQQREMVEQAPRPNQAPPASDAVSAWKRENASWFEGNGARNRAATVWAVERTNELKHLPVEEQLAIVDREVNEQFPGLKPGAAPRAEPAPAPRQQSTAVDPGSTSHARELIGGSKTPSYQSLSAEQKAGFDLLVQHGHAKPTAEDRKWYAEALAKGV